MVKSKSAVATTHVNGMLSKYTALKKAADDEVVDPDSDDNCDVYCELTAI